MVESTTNSEQYEVPFIYRKVFTPEQSTEMVKSFKNYDKDKSGAMDKAEFKAALVDMGYRDITDERVTELLLNVDKNNSGVIEWDEFLDMMMIITRSGKKSITEAINTTVGG